MTRWQGDKVTLHGAISAGNPPGQASLYAGGVKQKCGYFTGFRAQDANSLNGAMWGGWQPKIA